MKYMCEECSKIYNTEDEVRECELKHSEDKRIKTEKLAIQKSRWKEVCESEEKYKNLYANYLRDYSIGNNHSSPCVKSFDTLISDFLF